MPSIPSTSRALLRRARRVMVEVKDRVDRRSLDELGRAGNVRQSSAEWDTLSAIEAQLDPRAVRRVAVIVSGRAAATGTIYARRYRRAEVLVLVAGEGARPGRAHPRPRVTVVRARTVDAMHDALSAMPFPQVVIDAALISKDRKSGALRRLLFHLDDGGTYFVDGLPALLSPPLSRGRGLNVRQVVERFERLKADPGMAERELIHEDDVHRAAAISEIDAGERLITIRKKGRHALKLRDDTAARVLPRRFGPSWGREVEVKEPMAVKAAAALHTNDQADSFRTDLDTPRLYLRQYRDVVCAPRQLVVKDHVILPVSFHHGLRKRLEQASPLVRHVDAAFAELDPSVERAERLPGAYFHLDSEFPGHFGHLLTEDVSKLWAWAAAKAAEPELRVLVSTRVRGGTPSSAFLAILAAWGVPATDVVCVDRPVRVDVLYGASPMFYNGVYVHPELAAIWDRLRDGLRAKAETGPTPARIFVTRDPAGLRPCRNTDEVEQLFAHHGYAIVRPEQYPLAEQVRLFAAAEAVAGFGGSGLFNTIFSSRPGRRIVIASDEYRARNEWTIAALKGDDYHHFNCPPEVRSEDGRWHSKSFHSPFSFDFDRDGAALEALLKE